MYTLFIHIYSFLVRLAALSGNNKARQLAEGQKNIWKQISSALQSEEHRIWIHCASVGEFEQGRPLMEEIKTRHPQYKIVVTFFSPSGYELRKNYVGADYIFYLPYDTRRNAQRFIRLIHPQKIYFIKYEFWRNYLKTIKQLHIPLYLVSANFRSNQMFFRYYGYWFRKPLTAFTHFFVQNKTSETLLAGIGFKNVTVPGDTRFDRVCRIADQKKHIPEVEIFVDNKICMVAGSTWPPDEDILVRFINENKRGMKWIIAPHEIHDRQIKRLMESVGAGAVRYSQLPGANLAGYDILIIDNIGMLSSLYQYGTVAYIGGGFGKGIHNTLEAATYGIPVFFGPVHKKFREALDLIEMGGAFPVKNYAGFAQKLNYLLDNPKELKQAGDIAGAYVASGRGATEKIINKTMGKQGTSERKDGNNIHS
jgi:3-deoxy-D-manno-octulosonic-acid transferase